MESAARQETKTTLEITVTRKDGTVEHIGEFPATRRESAEAEESAPSRVGIKHPYPEGFPKRLPKTWKCQLALLSSEEDCDGPPLEVPYILDGMSYALCPAHFPQDYLERIGVETATTPSEGKEE